MPTNHSEVVEFLLSTNGEEMQFETTRCRPFLTPDFFEFLGDLIGETPRPAADLQACAERLQVQQVLT